MRLTNLMDNPLMKFFPNLERKTASGLGQRAGMAALSTEMPSALKTAVSNNRSANHVENCYHGSQKTRTKKIAAFLTDFLDYFIGQKLAKSIELTRHQFLSHVLKFLSSFFDSMIHI